MCSLKNWDSFRCLPNYVHAFICVILCDDTFHWFRYNYWTLQVTNETTILQTVCASTHLTSFLSDFIVPPNTIDFNTVWSKFANLGENAAVFSTVISLIGIYIIIIIWGRHMDKKDILKVILHSNYCWIQFFVKIYDVKKISLKIMQFLQLSSDAFINILLFQL